MLHAEVEDRFSGLENRLTGRDAQNVNAGTVNGARNIRLRLD